MNSCAFIDTLSVFQITQHFGICSNRAEEVEEGGRIDTSHLSHNNLIYLPNGVSVWLYHRYQLRETNNRKCAHNSHEGVCLFICFCCCCFW